MARKNKTIEICVGVGLDQFTPEYITVEIPRMTKAQMTEIQLQELIHLTQELGLYIETETNE